MNESDLSVLNPEQLAAVTHEGSPLLILAGAGSGKTRVITTKIAYLISQKKVRPSSILAVTFTKKAAKEMGERAVHLEPMADKAYIRTFHSFGAWFLRVHALDAGIDPNFTVYDDDDMVTLLTKAVPGLARNQAARVAHKISLAKDYCLEPSDPDLVKIESAPEFPEMYLSYQQRLRETGNVDFGDLIMLPVLILKNNPDIRGEIHSRFHVVMVDEYQDSNVAQFQLLEQLAGPDTYVCVVGDDDQSIYKFRGAEVQNILSFKDHFLGTTVIKLERNYRSVSPILVAADSVVSHNEDRLGKTLIAERGNGKKPVLIFVPTQDDETALCAELISQSHKKGCPYSDWAVLYRTNAQSLGFETEFLHRKIPYEVTGSLKFYEREEIKDLLALLAFIVNPRDEIAFRRMVNKPARGIGSVTQDKIIDKARESIDSVKSGLLSTAHEMLKGMSKKAKEGLTQFIELISSFVSMLDQVTTSESITNTDTSTSNNTGASINKETRKLSNFIEDLVQKSGLVEYYSAQDEISGTQRTGNLQELANSAVTYSLSREGLLEFLDHIELDRTLDKEETEENKDAVTLITLHNTKGLEFPRVIITGMESGIFPRRDKEGDELEEERRLFYVGITRARDELYFTCCSIRRMFGKTEYMEISPFLLELDQEYVQVLGNKPASYRLENKSSNNDTESILNTTDKDGLSAKWKRGVNVYHDDYGYGQIINSSTSDAGEYTITVQFETGGVKRFMPKYQSDKLMIGNR